MMAGGGSTIEELTKVDAPHHFAYHVGNIKGPLSFVASGIDGEFEFMSNGTETTTTWRWTVYPRSALAAPVLSVLGRIWHGWARRALEELSKQLVH